MNSFGSLKMSYHRSLIMNFCRTGVFEADMIYRCDNLHESTHSYHSNSNIFMISHVRRKHLENMTATNSIPDRFDTSGEGERERASQQRSKVHVAVDSIVRHAPCRRRPYRVECTGSLLTSEVKQRRARSVLGWGTAWEDLRVLSAFVVPQGLHPFHCCLEELLDPCHFGNAFRPCGLLA